MATKAPITPIPDTNEAASPLSFPSPETAAAVARLWEILFPPFLCLATIASPIAFHGALDTAKSDPTISNYIAAVSAGFIYVFVVMMTVLNFLIVFGAHNERQRASERDSDLEIGGAGTGEEEEQSSIPKEVVLAFLIFFIPMLFVVNIIAPILSWHFIETAIDDPTSAHIVAAVLAGLNQVFVLVSTAVFLWDVFGEDKQVKRSGEQGRDLESEGKEEKGDRGEMEKGEWGMMAEDGDEGRMAGENAVSRNPTSCP